MYHMAVQSLPSLMRMNMIASARLRQKTAIDAPSRGHTLKSEDNPQEEHEESLAGGNINEVILPTTRSSC
jgi:hypothetical protein